MSQINGFKLKGLNQDCNRIAVKSTHQSSWQMIFKKHVFSRAVEHEVGIHQNELCVITFQDGSGMAAIEITPLGERVGTLLMQSSRNAHKVLRANTKYRFELRPGESVTLRNHTIVYPHNEQPRGVAQI
jgi:hypothetical protein